MREQRRLSLTKRRSTGCPSLSTAASPPQSSCPSRVRAARPSRGSRSARWTSRTRSALTRVHPMTDEPLDLDKHPGMAAQKAVDLRRALAEAENHARELREREAALERRLPSAPSASWPEAAVKARYFLNLYAASLPDHDARHWSLIAAVIDDFAQLTGDG